MSQIMITLFNPANDRKSAVSGEEFEVDLTTMALPVHEAAADEVRFTSSIAGCVIEPQVLPVAVSVQENRVTKHFRMSIKSSSTELAEITARTASSGSADSFVIRVLAP
jgi:hypothetical protein